MTKQGHIKDQPIYFQSFKNMREKHLKAMRLPRLLNKSTNNVNLAQHRRGVRRELCRSLVLREANAPYREYCYAYGNMDKHKVLA
jgi:hypothetical protein